MALFGPILQLGFVVPDHRLAAAHWARLGVGPFFLMEHIEFTAIQYLGRPSQLDMSVALGQWGPVQVELIVQHDSTPSIYNQFDGSKHGGLQHVGVMTHSLADSLAELAKLGVQPVQSGAASSGVKFAYVSTDALPGAHPGSMVELIEHGPAIDGFFEKVRVASLNWDGRDPLRKAG